MQTLHSPGQAFSNCGAPSLLLHGTGESWFPNQGRNSHPLCSRWILSHWTTRKLQWGFILSTQSAKIWFFYFCDHLIQTFLLQDGECPVISLLLLEPCLFIVERKENVKVAYNSITWRLSKLVFWVIILFKTTVKQSSGFGWGRAFRKWGVDRESLYNRCRVVISPWCLRAQPG